MFLFCWCLWRIPFCRLPKVQVFRSLCFSVSLSFLLIGLWSIIRAHIFGGASFLSCGKACLFYLCRCHCDIPAESSKSEHIFNTSHPISFTHNGLIGFYCALSSNSCLFVFYSTKKPNTQILNRFLLQFYFSSVYYSNDFTQNVQETLQRQQEEEQKWWVSILFCLFCLYLEFFVPEKIANLILKICDCLWKIYALPLLPYFVMNRHLIWLDSLLLSPEGQSCMKRLVRFVVRF